MDINDACMMWWLVYILSRIFSQNKNNIAFICGVFQWLHEASSTKLGQLSFSDDLLWITLTIFLSFHKLHSVLVK